MHVLEEYDTAEIRVGLVPDDEGEKNAESGSCIEFYMFELSLLAGCKGAMLGR